MNQQCSNIGWYKIYMDLFESVPTLEKKLRLSGSEFYSVAATTFKRFFLCGSSTAWSFFSKWIFGYQGAICFVNSLLIISSRNGVPLSGADPGFSVGGTKFGKVIWEYYYYYHLKCLWNVWCRKIKIDLQIWGEETEPLFSLSVCFLSSPFIFYVYLGFFGFLGGVNVPSAPPPSESASDYRARIFYLMRLSIGRQCKEINFGMMWSLFLVRVMVHAARCLAESIGYLALDKDTDSSKTFQHSGESSISRILTVLNSICVSCVQI